MSKSQHKVRLRDFCPYCRWTPMHTDDRDEMSKAVRDHMNRAPQSCRDDVGPRRIMRLT